ncbi:MAG: YncE family protein [Solirubrobacterales bacterium]|nr:YncE family protein [Solirubrobacterales bacterium]
MDRRLLALALLCALLAVVAVGCGGEAEDAGLGPPPEPAESPELTREPAGETAEIGNGAEGIVVDPKTNLAAVGIEFPPSLALVDARTLEVERTISLPAHARHLELVAPGGPVLAPAEDADELVVTSLPEGQTENFAVGDFPHDATKLGERYFVGDEMSDTLTVLDSDGATIDTLETPVQPGNVDSAQGVIAVVAVTERRIATYDPESLEQLGELDAGEGPTHIATDGGRAFVIDTRGDAILEYRLAPELRLVGETPLEGTPYGVDIDARRDRLWVALSATNEAVELALTEEGLEEVARYPTIRQPNTIGVDPRTGAALVVSRTDPALIQRIEPKGSPVDPAGDGSNAGGASVDP